MSHTIRIKDLNLSQEAAREVAAFLSLRTQENISRRFMDGQVANGLGVLLPGWTNWTVIESDGSLAYDNYNGAWGDAKEAARFSALVLARMEGYAPSQVVLEEASGQITARVG